MTQGAATEAGAAFRPVKSADRTIDVLQSLASGPRSFSQLQASLGLPKSSLHAIVRTLQDRHWIEQAESGRFGLGLGLIEVASAYLETDDTVRRTAGLLDRLADATGETVQLARLDDADVVYLSKRDSGHPVRLISTVGSRLPAHATALGKALLAGRRDDDVRAALSFPMRPLTARTITDWERLREDLDGVRERGYAVDNEEAADGLRCFAVTPRGTRSPMNAISVSVPSFRLSGEREQMVISALLEVRDAWAGAR
jgi:DNA-binding IclR family transcriptional regulator